MGKTSKIVIIGAGLAGLSCAYYLEKAGFAPVIYEKSASIGGRVQTDHYQGFLLDRGFQVLLSNYPEVNSLFDLSDLKLKFIPSGARIYYEGKWYLLENPLQNPAFLYQARNLPFIKGSDFFRAAKLYGMTWTETLSKAPLSTMDFLKQGGLSDSFIDAFWRPFFGGVFLDLDLRTQAPLFARLANYFVRGMAALPQDGMQAVPQLLLNKLKTTALITQSEVREIDHRSLVLESGEVIQADYIVLATNGEQARQLIPTLSPCPFQSVTCLYFSLDATALSCDSYLHLNGTGQGPINNLLFNNLTQPSYAPANQLLASVSVIDTHWQAHPHLKEVVQDQLCGWFSTTSQKWNHLRTYRILQALPDQSGQKPLKGQTHLSPSLFLCGELVDEASINGALYSGRRLARALAALHGKPSAH